MAASGATDFARYVAAEMPDLDVTEAEDTAQHLMHGLSYSLEEGPAKAREWEREWNLEREREKEKLLERAAARRHSSSHASTIEELEMASSSVRNEVLHGVEESGEEGEDMSKGDETGRLDVFRDEYDEYGDELGLGTQQASGSLPAFERDPSIVDPDYFDEDFD